MDHEKVGNLIRTLRVEQQLTQKQLAEQLHVSDKTISKWERGCGLPDVSLLPQLSHLLQIDIEMILQGDLSPNHDAGGNMKKANYYLCPICGNISLCTGDATVSCCGRKLEALVPQKANESQKLRVEPVENEWYLSSDHPMCKENYIAFVAFATGEHVQLIPQYPEWNLSLRIPQPGHGMLLWYSQQEGLLYQLL